MLGKLFWKYSELSYQLLYALAYLSLCDYKKSHKDKQECFPFISIMNSDNTRLYYHEQRQTIYI